MESGGNAMITRRTVLRSLAAGAALTLSPSNVVLQAAPLTPPAPLIPSKAPTLTEALDHDAWACWIGHATVLIRMAGKWILTDPVLFDAYGIHVLGLTLGPRRYTPPALSIDEIPRPDLILLSHAHLDHMDRRTLIELSERYPGQIDVITATNTKDVIEDLEWRSLNEMDWGDHVAIDGLEITALQVEHNGWRMPGEACRASGQRRTGRSYNGYHLESSHTSIVFGGDTAYTTQFGNIKRDVELAIMPIGAYRDCHAVHCNPEEAHAMVTMMKARRMLPIHHGTFNQQCEPAHEPIQRLLTAVTKDRRAMLAGIRTGQPIALA
jgi:L-ascorbate metabolism protein UlaG (beta-lactamase superfamily)